MFIVEGSNVICIECFLVDVRGFYGSLYVVTITFCAREGDFRSGIWRRAIYEEQSKTGIARRLENYLYGVDLLSGLFDVGGAVVEFVQFDRSVVFVSVNVPIGIATIGSDSTGLRDVSIRVFNYKVNSSVDSPFGEATICEYDRNIICGGQGFVFVDGLYRFFGVGGCRNQIYSNLYRGCLYVEARNDYGFFETDVNIGRDTIGTGLFRNGDRRIGNSSMGDEDHRGVVAYFTSVRSYVRINDLSKENGSDNGAALRVYGFYYCDVVYKILRANVRMSFYLGVRRLSRFVDDVVFVDNALVGQRYT